MDQGKVFKYQGFLCGVRFHFHESIIVRSHLPILLNKTTIIL